MIRLSNIEKAFAHGVTKTFVLRRIDLDIQQGEFVSIMGPSGAGKSTLLHILGMHDQSWGGEYYFDDVAVHSLNHRKRAELRNRNIGFVFQSYHLLDDQTVSENLELPLSYRDVGKKDRQSIVCDTLDRFQIVGKKDLFPSQLSGGQQQLVGIARAVVANPRIILADEPTGNLDSRTSIEVLDVFQYLNREHGITIALVTHEPDIAEYTKRVVVFKDGRIKRDQPVTNPRSARDELDRLPPITVDDDEDEDE